MLEDLRFAVRLLVKNPSFTVVAIFTLALGIGANTAIFSVVNAVLLRPLPYPHPGQLVLLRERLARPSGFESGSVSYMNYLDWRAAQRSFTDLALVRREGVNVSNADTSAPPERLGAARITANYLSILQVAPRIGRDLLDKDDVPGAGKVALISERFWRSRFGALPLVIGQQLSIDGMPREIVGVVPERVRFPRDCDIFSRSRICAPIMIFFLAGIMRDFPLSDGSSQTPHSNRRLQISTRSPPILPAVIPIQTQIGKSRRSRFWNLPSATIVIFSTCC